MITSGWNFILGAAARVDLSCGGSLAGRFIRNWLCLRLREFRSPQYAGCSSLDSVRAARPDSLDVSSVSTAFAIRIRQFRFSFALKRVRRPRLARGHCRNRRSIGHRERRVFACFLRSGRSFRAGASAFSFSSRACNASTSKSISFLPQLAVGIFRRVVAAHFDRRHVLLRRENHQRLAHLRQRQTAIAGHLSSPETLRSRPHRDAK